MKLEVGMYVRIDGFITRIDHIKESSSGTTYIQFKQPNGMIARINSNLLEKEPNHNIIKLLEVGDYVNDYRIVGICKNRPSLCVEIKCGINVNKLIYEKDIKSIVTKEQFEAVEYKVN